jgi:hypothetical protein
MVAAAMALVGFFAPLRVAKPWCRALVAVACVAMVTGVI